MHNRMMLMIEMRKSGSIFQFQGDRDRVDGQCFIKVIED